MEFLEIRLGTVAVTLAQVEPFLASALDITARRFSTIRSRYFSDEAGRCVMRTAHYSQFILFLHALSRQAFLAQEITLADRLYHLNVATGACDLFYEVDLPLRTHCDHPLGAVIGRGVFGSQASLSFTTGCTIGNNWGRYPRIDGALVMYPNSALLGETTIRGTVVLSRGGCLQDAGDVSDCIVFGSRGEYRKPLAPVDAMDKYCPFKP